MLRRAALAASAVLVLFHLWLFAGQAWDGQLFETARLTRWLGAAGLAAALLSLRRRGVSVVRGRRAVAIWLLAGLLHGPAVGQAIEDADGSPLEQVVATLVQVGVASVAGFLLALAAWLLARNRPSPYLFSSRLLRVVSSRRLPGPDAFLVAAPRPPPSA